MIGLENSFFENSLSGDIFEKKIEYKPLEDSKYTKELKLEIIKNSKKWREFFTNVDNAKQNIFTNKLSDYTRSISDVVTREKVVKEIKKYDNKYGK